MDNTCDAIIDYVKRRHNIKCIDVSDEITYKNHKFYTLRPDVIERKCALVFALDRVTCIEFKRKIWTNLQVERPWDRVVFMGGKWESINYLGYSLFPEHRLLDFLMTRDIRFRDVCDCGDCDS